MASQEKSPRFGRCEVWLHYLQTPLSNYEPCSPCDDDDAVCVTIGVCVHVRMCVRRARISRPHCYLSNYQDSLFHCDIIDNFTHKKNACARTHTHISRARTRAHTACTCLLFRFSIDRPKPETFGPWPHFLLCSTWKKKATPENYSCAHSNGHVPPKK